MAEPSRQELVNWVNSTLQLKISKVDECGKGFVFCQLLDSIYLDIPVNRVKFDARNEYEYLNNFKILQAAFTSHSIDRPIPVERLVKCRLQDNLEFLQWFKHYWDSNYPGHDYDPVARRGAKTARAPSVGASHRVTPGSGRSSGTSTPNLPPRSASAARSGSSVGRSPVVSSGNNSAISSSRPVAGSSARATPRSSHNNAPPASSGLRATNPPSANRPLSSKTAKPTGAMNRGPSRSGNQPNIGANSVAASNPRANINNTNGRSSSSAATAAAQNSSALSIQNERLQHEIEEIKTQYIGLENEYEELNQQVELVTSEREFYFKKLRDIEIMVQTLTDLRKQKQQYDSAQEIKKGRGKGNDDKAKSDKNDTDLDIPDIDPEALEMLKPDNIIRTIAEILYSTEEGFESPSGQEEDMMDDEMELEGSAGGMEIDVIPEGDDETF